MAKLNTARKPTVFTEQGAQAKRINPEQQLRRLVMSCMLWEKEFYVDGQTISEQIFDAVKHAGAHASALIAMQARSSMNLRHAPLLVAASMAYHFRGDPVVGRTIADVIQRADELAEIISICAHLNGVTPDKVKPVLGAQVKKGVAEAFQKFDAYSMAKYNRKSAITLRDALFLVHAKPKDEAQAAIWQKLIDGKLESPDTWEVGLSGGGDKKETFERLLAEGKLGYLALLRNLRNMVEAKVDLSLVRDALAARKGAGRVLPFRFVAAARQAPQLEPAIDAALLASLEELPKLKGRTAVLIDVSGSMEYDKVSARSDMSRLDAAATLGAVIPAEELRVFTFSMSLVECPARRGMAGVDVIIGSQPHGGTYLGQAVSDLMRLVEYDRLIVITDEQSADRVPDPKGRAYMINVASNKNGVGYGKWIHIDGFSESVIRYIQALESE
ncbi:TROVE domain-containing protein [Allohahella sp. A8]|uniref:TROVE domain-containing protein n=1 Tax=Allohahella sp. A8 TaxID=3141461 RepID=UPI003A812CC5